MVLAQLVDSVMTTSVTITIHLILRHYDRLNFKYKTFDIHSSMSGLYTAVVVYEYVSEVAASVALA